MLFAQLLPWVLQHVPTAIFVFCFGACVGSFLNVVIYRLPAGMSVTTPPSRCPTCGARLRFFRENIPILGWFFVRGRCRYCGVKVSAQYMIIELMMALAFLGLYLMLYTASPSTASGGGAGGWWGQVGGDWWYRNGLFKSWPAFIAMAFLIAGLAAMTIIDARTFTIPLQIPLFVTFTAFIVYPLQAILPLSNRTALEWPIPALCWPGVGMALGGMAGLMLSYTLLRTGRIGYSFADYADYLPEAGDEPSQSAPEPLSTDRVTPFELFYFLPVVIGLIAAGFVDMWAAIAIAFAVSAIIMIILSARRASFGEVAIETATPTGEQVLAPAYPHARREVLREVAYLMPCIIGLIAGFFIARWLTGGTGAGAATAPPVWLQALGGSFAGYIMGGGLVWGIRILGTLGFGREAMGLGDVHLLAAVGAVLGWFDPILIFFLAPFSGLFWVFVSMGVASVFKRARRELPYGPHLAVATLAVILLRPGIARVWNVLMPAVPMPASSLCSRERAAELPRIHEWNRRWTQMNTDKET